MSRDSFRQRDIRRVKFGIRRPGPKVKTLRERLQRVVSSPNPFASTEVSKKEAAAMLDTMSWREKRARERAEYGEVDDRLDTPKYASLSSSVPGASYRAKKRKARYSKVARAGCYVCEPEGEVMWRNIGSAARHYDATGHNTWSESDVKVWYGEQTMATEQEGNDRKETTRGEYEEGYEEEENEF